MAVATQAQGVRVTAVVWPPCECGAPYALHRPISTECAGYRPSRPVTQLGTRAYVPRPSLGGWRRLLCRAAWALEYRLQGWRERTEWH